MSWTFTVGAVVATFEPQADDNRRLTGTREVRSQTNMYIGGTAGRIDVFGYGPLVFAGGSFDIRCSTTDALKLLNTSQLLGRFGTLSDGITNYSAALLGANLAELLASQSDYEYAGTVTFEALP